MVIQIEACCQEEESTLDFVFLLLRVPFFFRLSDTSLIFIATLPQDYLLAPPDLCKFPNVKAPQGSSLALLVCTGAHLK